MIKELKNTGINRNNGFIGAITAAFQRITEKFKFTAKSVDLYLRHHPLLYRVFNWRQQDLALKYDNFYVHATDSRILLRLEETGYKLMPGMDLLSGKGVAPYSGEMTVASVRSRLPVCFGRIKSSRGSIYNIDYLMEEYSGGQEFRAAYTKAETGKVDFEEKLRERMRVGEWETGKLQQNRNTVFKDINPILIGVCKLVDRGIALDPGLLSDFESKIEKLINYFQFFSLFDGLLAYEDDDEIIWRMLRDEKLSVCDVGDAVDIMEEKGFFIQEKLDYLDNVKYLFRRSQAIAKEELAEYTEISSIKEEKIQVQFELWVAKAEKKAGYLDNVSVDEVIREGFSTAWTWEDIALRLQKMSAGQEDIQRIKENFELSRMTEKELGIINESLRQVSGFEIVRYLYMNAQASAEETANREKEALRWQESLDGENKVLEGGETTDKELKSKHDEEMKAIRTEKFSSDWTWEEIEERLKKMSSDPEKLKRIRERYEKSILIDGILVDESYDLLVCPQTYDMSEISELSRIKYEYYEIEAEGESLKEYDANDLKGRLKIFFGGEKRFKKYVDEELYDEILSGSADLATSVLSGTARRSTVFAKKSYDKIFECRRLVAKNGRRLISYFDNRSFYSDQLLYRRKVGFIASKARQAYCLYCKRLDTLRGLISRNRQLKTNAEAQEVLEKGFPVAFLVDETVASEKKMRPVWTEFRSHGSYQLGKDIKHIVAESKAHAYELYSFFKKAGLDKDIDILTKDQLSKYNGYSKKKPS